MPGTIHVSVMDFVGPQSPSPTSQICVKLSMGRREYQTREGGDFLFQLMTLRDNLVVVLEDAEGNSISHAVIASRTVVEKGTWDDIFNLEGGGQVHLKLRFILTEEEIKRIHMMRLSALQKKQGELLKKCISSPSSPTYAVTTNKGATQAGGLSNPVDSLRSAKSSTENVQGTCEPLTEPAPNVTEIGKANPLDAPVSRGTDVCPTEDSCMDLVGSAKAKARSANIPVKEANKEVTAFAGNSVPEKLDEGKVISSEKPRPLGKSSNNVRRMISAFEGGLAQDMGLQTKSLMTKLESRKTEKEAPTEDNCLEKALTYNPRLAEPISGTIVGPFSNAELPHILRFNLEKGGQAVSAGDLGGTRSDDPQHIESKLKRVQATIKNKFELAHHKMDAEEGKNSLNDINGASTFTTAAVSGRVLDRNQCREESRNLLDDGNASVGDINSETENIHLKYGLEDSQSSSNVKSISVGYHENKKDNLWSSGTWIFPAAGKSFCVTTAGKQVMDLVNGYHPEAKFYQGKVKEYRTDSGTIPTRNEEGTSETERRSDIERSGNVETPKGPLRQVIKIAVMVGFGTLVLITRQRQNR